MADTPAPTPRPASSALARAMHQRAEDAESTGVGFILIGYVFLVIGVVLALLKDRGLVCLILGGISLVIGYIENLRAEVLRVRARLEKE
jgi:hypothetical protein